jgi:competence protein ComEC
VADRLAELGIERLGAVVITHDELDHSGGLAEVLARARVDTLAFAAPDRDLEALAAGAGTEVRRLAEGQAISSGGLRLEVAWPPAELTDSRPPRGTDPNTLALVAVARWRHFSALLTGDAEAEAIRLDPGPVDVLKLAHHGSADSGLASLLERTAPRLAVASVGATNPFGHPAAETLATLDERSVPLLRTDEAGEITVRAQADGWSVLTAE